MLTQSSRRIAIVFSFVGVLLSATFVDTADAQRQRRSSRYSSYSRSTVFRQFYDRKVTTELGLSDETKKKIIELSRKSRMDRDESRKFNARITKAKSEAEKTKIRAEMGAAAEKIRKDAEGSAMKLLTEAQRTRFGQLKWRLHPSGTRAVLDDEAAALLKITDDQKKKFTALFDERKKAAEEAGLYKFGASRESLAKFKAEWDPKTITLLNAGQQKQWMAMIGPDLKANLAASKVPNTKSVPGLKTPAAPVTPAAPLTQTTPAPKDFTASFDASTAAQRKKAIVKYGAGTETGTETGNGATRQAALKRKTGKKEPLMSFNFKNAPWKVVFDFFALKTGLALDNSKSPPDTFTYEDPNLYTVTQALDVLNGYLLGKNFILIRRHNALVVHDLVNPVPPSLVPDVSITDLPNRGRNELMRVTFQLIDSVDPVEVSKDVEAISGVSSGAMYAKVATFATAQQVIVTDIGSALLRIHKSIEKVIVPPDDAKLSFRRFQLEVIPASEAVKIISEQLGLQTGVTNVSGRGSSSGSSSRFRRSGYTPTETIQFQRGSRGGSSGGRSGGSRSSGGSDRRSQFLEMMRSRISQSRSGSTNSRTRGGTTTNSRGRSSSNNTLAKVTADTRTNAVLVTAPLEQIKIVEEIVLAIDIPLPDGVDPRFAENAEDNEPYLKVYKIYNGDVMEITKTLNAIVPGLVVNEDGRNGLIHVMATRSEHAYVAELIGQLDNDFQGGPGGSTFAVIQLRGLDAVAVSVTLNAMFANGNNQRGNSNAPSIQADVQGRRLIVKGSEAQIASIRKVVEDLDIKDRPGSPLVNGGNIRKFRIPGDPEQFLKVLRGSLPQFDINVVIPGGRDPIQNRITPSQNGRTETDRRRRLRGDAPTDAPKRPTTDIRGGSRQDFAPRGDYERPVDRRGYVMARRRDFALGKKTPARQARTAPVRRAARGNINEISAIIEPEDKTAPKSAAKTAPKTAPKTAKAKAADPKKEDSKAAAKSDAKKTPATKSGTKPKVSIIVRDGELIITSDDTAALDHVQGLVEALLLTYQSKTSWTVFYLRTADATQTAEMLEQIFPSSSVANTDMGGGGLMSGLTSGLSNFGNSVMDMTGLNSLGAAESLRIIPDLRSNSLFVSGPASMVRDVERVLKILDTDSLPASLRDRVPRMIPVYYANVMDVYQNVSDVYKDYMQAARGGAQAGGANIMAAMLGGGNSRGGGGRGGNRGGGRQQQQQQQVRLTLSVDERTGQLIVSSSDAIFQQIDDLVFMLDKSAFDAKPTSRVVTLENVTPTVIAQTLTTMYPNVSVSVTSARDRSRRDNGQNGIQQQQQRRGGDAASAAIRAQMMQRGFGGQSRGGDAGRGGRTGFNPGGGGARNTGGGNNRGGGSRGGGSRGGRGGRSGRG